MTVDNMLPVKQAYIDQLINESNNPDKLYFFRELIKQIGPDYFKTYNNNNNYNDYDKKWMDNEVIYYKDLHLRASGDLRKVETLRELKLLEGIPPIVVTLVEKTIFYMYKTRVGVLQTYLQGGNKDMDKCFKLSYENHSCFSLPYGSGQFMELTALLESNSDTAFRRDHQMQIIANDETIAFSHHDDDKIEVRISNIRDVIKQCSLDVSALDFLVYSLACNLYLEMLFDIVDGRGSEGKDLWLRKTLTKVSRVRQLFGTPKLAPKLKAIKQKVKEIKRENGWDGRHHPKFTLWEYAEDDCCVLDKDEDEDKDKDEDEDRVHYEPEDKDEEEDEDEDKDEDKDEEEDEDEDKDESEDRR